MTDYNLNEAGSVGVAGVRRCVVVSGPIDQSPAPET